MMGHLTMRFWTPPPMLSGSSAINSKQMYANYKMDASLINLKSYHYKNPLFLKKRGLFNEIDKKII